MLIKWEIPLLGAINVQLLQIQNIKQIQLGICSVILKELN